MNIYEFAQKMSELQKNAIPSYITELRKISERYNSQQGTTMTILTDFQLNYRPLKLVLPSDYQSDLTSSLKGLNRIAEILNSTIPDLSAFEYNLEDFAKEEQEESRIIKLVDDTKIILRDIYEKHELIDIVDPRDFEKIVAELLHDKGYEVQLTKQTRDGGYDVLALKKIDGFPFKILAECKRHKKAIGIEIIRSFSDVINRENANKGVIFTTSYFSKPALDRQTEMGTILDLRDRGDLIEWIIKYHEK